MSSKRRQKARENVNKDFCKRNRIKKVESRMEMKKEDERDG